MPSKIELSGLYRKDKGLLLKSIVSRRIDCRVNIDKAHKYITVSSKNEDTAKDIVNVITKEINSIKISKISSTVNQVLLNKILQSSTFYKWFEKLMNDNNFYTVRLFKTEDNEISVMGIFDTKINSFIDWLSTVISKAYFKFTHDHNNIASTILKNYLKTLESNHYVVIAMHPGLIEVEGFMPDMLLVRSLVEEKLDEVNKCITKEINSIKISKISPTVNQALLNKILQSSTFNKWFEKLMNDNEIYEVRLFKTEDNEISAMGIFDTKINSFIDWLSNVISKAYFKFTHDHNSAASTILKDYLKTLESNHYVVIATHPGLIEVEGFMPDMLLVRSLVMEKLDEVNKYIRHYSIDQMEYRFIKTFKCLENIPHDLVGTTDVCMHVTEQNETKYNAPPKHLLSTTLNFQHELWRQDGSEEKQNFEAVVLNSRCLYSFEIESITLYSDRSNNISICSDRLQDYMHMCNKEGKILEKQEQGETSEEKSLNSDLVIATKMQFVKPSETNERIINNSDKNGFKNTTNDHQRTNNSKSRKRKAETHNNVVVTDLNNFIVSENDVSDGPPDNKKSKYSNFAMNMMMQMGYKEGKGLGKHEQGISEPIEASKQKGTRGLGLHTGKTGLEPSNVTWNFESEQLGISEVIDWLPNPSIITKIPHDWLEEGPIKLSIDDEAEFCDEMILSSVLDGKTIFDAVDPKDMRGARTRSNPYETIKSAFFLNRAAMKMANMDAVFDFMFTSPKNTSGEPLVNKNELFTFADVCAGPGGFSEYVLWRMEGRCKGFGFTLKGENDFKLEDFHAGPSEMFEPHYGVNGPEGTGDIFDIDNQSEFENFVKRRTKNMGVHLVMADGGFSVDGKENIQEILSHRLYLCQFLVALSILRDGGNFVCKLFDLFTPFSVGLIFLMSHCFRRINIFKPVTSRPANSERYLICESFSQSETSYHILNYFRVINERMGSSHLGDNDSDWMIRSIVPIELLKESVDFNEFIYKSNNFLGDLQKVSLFKIKTFVQNESLVDKRQEQVRKDCLKNWKIPDEKKAKEESPKDKQFVSPSQRFSQLVNDTYSHASTLLTPTTISEIKCMRVVMVTVTASKERCLLLALERGMTYIRNCTTATAKWERLEMPTNLPKNTILEVELVEEQRGEDKGRKKVKVVHVFDLIMWFGKNLTQLHFDERQHLLRLLISASTKVTQTQVTPMHVKQYHSLSDVNQNIFNQLQYGLVKGGGYVPKLLLPIHNHQGDDVTSEDVGDNKRNHRYMVPHGLYMVTTCPLPWIIGWSKSQSKSYYYHTIKRISSFDRPVDALGTYDVCKKNSFYWQWGEEVKMVEKQMVKDAVVVVAGGGGGGSLLSKEVFLENMERLSRL